jgi:hypothetical protein
MKAINDFREFVYKHKLAWPAFNFLYIDPDRQNELLNMEPFPESGLPCEEALTRILIASATVSDEDLRTVVLLARLTRPKGLFYWILRFVYESRGLTLHEDDAG